MLLSSCGTPLNSSQSCGFFFGHKVNCEYCVRYCCFINDYRSSNLYNGHKAPGGCRPLTNPGNLQGSQSKYPVKLVPTHPAPTEFIHHTNFKSQLASNVYYGVLFGRIRWLYFFLDVHDFRFVCFYFNGIVFLVKVWPLFEREFPRVPMTQRTALARFSNVKSLVSTMRLPWIAWTENAILWNMIIYHETFFDIFSATNLYNNYLIKTPHPTAFHLQQFRGSCHHLWFTVGILWHWNEPGYALVRHELYCFRKIFDLGFD